MKIKFSLPLILDLNNADVPFGYGEIGKIYFGRQLLAFYFLVTFGWRTGLRWLSLGNTVIG